MGKYVIRRILQAIMTLIGVSIVLFVCLFVLNDPLATFGEKERSPAAKAQLEAQYNLDKPLPVQYLKWVTNAMQGDLGRSVSSSRQPVNEIVKDRVPQTVKLAIAAIILELAIGITAGLISALFRYSFWDILVTLTTTILIGFATFVLALIVQYLFAIKWRLFPLNGTPPDGFFGIDKKLIMPAFTLAAIDAAVLARLMRGTMLEVLRADYVRTARAKGLSERTVVLKHALRNAIIPVVTYTGVTFGTLAGGAIITESTFNYKGLGRTLIDAIYSEDTPLVMGIVTYIVVVVVVVSLVVDLLYAWLDPRIRLE